MTVRKSLAQQEEYRVRDTDGSGAWQALIDDLHAEFDQGHMTVYGIVSRHRVAIEAEAALLARRAPGDREIVLTADDREAIVDALVAAGMLGTLERWRRALRADSRTEQPAPLDVERLARALSAVDHQGAIALLGTDDRVDAKGYPLRHDYTGVPSEVAAALAAEYAAPVRPEEPPE